MLKNEDLKFNKVECAINETKHPTNSALWAPLSRGKGDTTRVGHPIYSDPILYKQFANLVKKKGLKINDVFESFMRDFVRHK